MFYSAKNTLLSPEHQRGKIIILFMLITLAPQLAIDLYLPSMPAMQLHFHTTHTYIQYTLIFYLFGTGATQFIYGPLIDKYGRRPLILFGLSLFFIGSLGCTQTDNIHWFLVYRLLQGTADGAIFVAYRAVMRDLYDDNDLSKIISFVSIAWIMTPILAPFFGGYIQHFYGWEMIFNIIFVCSALMLIAAWKLFPETRHNIDPNSITEHRIIKKYLTILKNPLFIFFSVSAMLTNVIMLCYNLVSPFLLQNSLHLTPITFGWSAAFVACGYIVGSLINGSWVTRLGKYVMIFSGTVICLTGALALFILALSHHFTVAAIIIPIAIIFIGFGILYPNFSASAMKPFKHMAGTAGAMQGTIQTGIGVLISLSVIFIPHQTALGFSVLCLIIITLMAITILGARRYDR